MNKSNLKVRLFIWAVVLVVLLSAGYLWQRDQATAPTVNESNSLISEKVEAVPAYLKIEGVYENELAVQAIKGQTLLGLMSQINEADPTLLLETQDYPGLGSLVIRIGDLRNGDDNKYWQYYVNGEMPPVGADTYVLQAGDKVEWKFMESDF